MRHRRTLPAAAAIVVALLAAGCNPGHSVGEIPDEDTTTPDETPIIEPVSPPANEVELPDEEPGNEGGVPDDNELGTDDGEQ